MGVGSLHNIGAGFSLMLLFCFEYHHRLMGIYKYFNVKCGILDIIGIPSEDILVVPLDLLETESHAQTVITVLKHFKEVSLNAY